MATRRGGRIRLAFLLLLLLAIGRTAWVPLADIGAGIYLAVGVVAGIWLLHEGDRAFAADLAVVAAVGAAVLSS